MFTALHQFLMDHGWYLDLPVLVKIEEELKSFNQVHNPVLDAIEIQITSLTELLYGYESGKKSSAGTDALIPVLQKIEALSHNCNIDSTEERIKRYGLQKVVRDDTDRLWDCIVANIETLSEQGLSGVNGTICFFRHLQYQCRNIIEQK